MSIFFSPICFLMAIAALVYSIAGWRKRNRVLNTWIKLDNAVVLDSKVEVADFWAYAVVEYEYHSGNHRFVGESSPGVSWNGWVQQAQRVADGYNQGDVISIYVNPDNHQETLIRPQPSVGLCVFGLIFAVAIFLLGVWITQNYPAT